MLYLIDTENISLKKLLNHIKIKEKDKIMFFYSGNCPAIPIELVETLKKQRVKSEYINVVVGKHNALDFQLVSYLGYILRFRSKAYPISIVSNDKAFECVAQFWNKKGYNIGVIQQPSEYAEINKARQRMLSIQKQDLSSKLFTNIHNNRERWNVVNFVTNPNNTKTDINRFLTQRYDGKILRNINNIIRPYIAKREG